MGQSSPWLIYDKAIDTSASRIAAAMQWPCTKSTYIASITVSPFLYYGHEPDTVTSRIAKHDKNIVHSFEYPHSTLLLLD